MEKYSKNCNSSGPSTKIDPASCLNEAKPESFEEIFTEIMEDIFDINSDSNGNFSKEIKEITEYNLTCLKYNVPHGKMLRGKLLVTVYQSIVPNATPEQLKMARILGCSMEVLQAACLVADDIMDNGETRRGRPCWYRLKGIRSAAVNDSFFLEHFAYQILLKYFGHLNCYNELITLLLGVNYKTVLGQGLDTLAGRDEIFDSYDENFYQAMVFYKTSYYTGYLPVALALVFAGVKPKDTASNQEFWESIEQVTLKIGEMFQVQDDFFDCFGEQKLLGKKMGTDIEEGKCTWLFVMAKKILGNTEKFEILKSNYGNNDTEKVHIVKAIYAELGMIKEFSDWQSKCYQEILEGIKKLDDTPCENALTLFLDRIYERVY